MIIEGNVSVKAALIGGRREVIKIYVDATKKDKDTSWILHRAEEKNVEIVRCKREEIDEIATGRTHGGLLAEAGPRTSTRSIICAGNDFKTSAPTRLPSNT